MNQPIRQAENCPLCGGKPAIYYVEEGWDGECNTCSFGKDFPTQPTPDIALDQFNNKVKAFEYED